MSVHLNKKRKQFYICYHSKDENGKYKTYTITNAKWTQDKGIKYMRSIEEEMIIEDKRKRKLRLSKGNELTLEDLINLYEKTLENKYKPQTCYNKTLLINKYVVPNLPMTKSLNEALKINVIDKFHNAISSAKVGVKSKNAVLTLFKEILDYGSARDYISYELLGKLTRILEPFKDNTIKNDKLCFWTIEEWNKFIETFSDLDKFKMLFVVDYMCALRLGELLALKWNDFDEDKKTLRIDESIDNQGNTTTPKNSASNATVSLSTDLTEKLKQYKIDTCGNDNDYIFFAEHRTSRTTIRRVMTEHIELAKVPFIKFHGLRHSCASRMINAGCSPLIVSKHLRHASTQQTLDTYSHLFPNETVGLMDKIF